MDEPKTNCSHCNREILQTTADRNAGLCAVCVREQQQAKNVQTYVPIPPDPIHLNVKVDLKSLVNENAVDWKKVEDALVLIASQYVQAFADIHCDKTFYGIAFDCNADYSQVIFCANTFNDLCVSAKDYKKKWPDEDWEGQLRWSLGDWKFGSANTDGFSDAWKPIKKLLQDLIPWPDDDDEDEDDGPVREDSRSFMQMACHAMVRLETSGVLNRLSRTADFKTFVADHDEDEAESWKRLESIRASS